MAVTVLGPNGEIIGVFDQWSARPEFQGDGALFLIDVLGGGIYDGAGGWIVENGYRVAGKALPAAFDVGMNLVPVLWGYNQSEDLFWYSVQKASIELGVGLVAGFLTGEAGWIVGPLAGMKAGEIFEDLSRTKLYPGATDGSSWEDQAAAIAYQWAANTFYGMPGDSGSHPLPSDLSHVGDVLASRFGLSAADLTAERRREVAIEFDQGLSRSQAHSRQIEIFMHHGLSRDQARALTAYREAYKFGDDAAMGRALAALEPMWVQTPNGRDFLYPPAVEDKVWTFCFEGHTPILMAGGGLRHISEIKVGDEVLAYSETAEGGRGALVARRVTHLFRNLTDQWIELSNGVVVTPGHLFLTSDGTFESIERILADRNGVIVTADGDLQQLSGRLVRFSAANADLYPHLAKTEYATEGGVALAPRQRYGWVTYNFEVEDLHTYVAGGMRVHNMCIDQETQLTIVDAFTANGHDYTQIAGYGGEVYNLRNDKVYFEHKNDYGFEKLPDGSDYAFKRYDPKTGVTFYYTEERLKELGYNPTQTPSDHTTSDKPSTVDEGSSSSSSSSGGSSNGNSGSTDKPVLIDLDGDGIEITPLDSSNFYFDMAGDGMDHRTAWAGAGDGVLVRDAGNDGIIENRNEVDFTDWDSTAQTDMQALRNVFDTNHDGKLDASDADWSLFKVLVTNPDGTTTLKTMAELGITSINLISNNQEITLPDGSKILGTTTYTRSDGSTGTAADTALKYDANGYIVAQTVTTNPDGSTTIVNKATRPNGSLASETVSTVSADGKTRSVSFDNNGDGVVDRVQTDVTVANGDGSTTNTLSDYDGSGTILLRRQVTLTSADRKTVTVSRDLDGSGNYDQVETRVTGVDGSLTLTVTQLNADGTTRYETTTVTSADGHSKTTHVELTGSGAINASQVETTSVAGDGTRTETLTNYAGAGTAAANRVGGSTTVTSADGTSKTVSTDLDGNASVDLSSQSLIVHNANGSTTTTVSRFNGDATLRDRTLVTRSADGNSKTTAVDADGNGSYDLTTADVTVFNADGSTTRTITDTFANGSIQDKSVLSWSADGKTRSISVDSDGDGAFDRVETVAVVGGNSVDTVSIYSANGTTLLSKSVTTTSANGLSQTVEVDADADGSYDSLSTRSTTLNPDGSSTVTVVSKNGAGTVQIGKTVTTTSADGLSATAESYLGTQTSPYQTTTSTTLRNADGSTITTAVNYAGTSHVQTARSVTTVSADRLTTTTSSYVGTNVLPESVATTATNADGSKTQTVSSYAPNGTTLTAKTISVVSADGLTSTTTVDTDGNAVIDQTLISVTTLNTDGTTTATRTTYAGSGTLSTNQIGRVIVDTSANGLVVITQTDANGDGIVDAKQVDTTVLNSDGSRTRTVVSSNGAGTVQTGKSVATVSDDGLTVTTANYVGDHATADRTITSVTEVGSDGSRTETVSTYNADTELIERTVTALSGDGLTTTLSRDTDGDGVNDFVSIRQRDPATGISTTSAAYLISGVMTPYSTTTMSADGLSSATIAHDDFSDGSTDGSRSRSSTLTLNGDGSRTEAGSRTVDGYTDTASTTTSADGLSVTTEWTTHSRVIASTRQTDVTAVNADGSSSRVVSHYEGETLHDRATTTISADRLTSTVARDSNGDGSIDQTVVTIKAADGSLSSSAMDGNVLSASGRSYGSVHGRYEKVSADGLTHTTQYDANGNGLAELQSVVTRTLNADGSTVETVTNSTLTGGVASAANPIYTATLRDKVVVTTSADGLVETSLFDLTGVGSFQKSKTEIATLGPDGSSTQTVSYFEGATLKARYETVVSGDGLATTRRWDSTGSGSFDQQSVSVSSLLSDGTRVETVTNTGTGGTLLSKYVTTSSTDGRTVTTEKDTDGNGSFDESETSITMIRPDGSTVITKRHYAGSILLDEEIINTSDDGGWIVISRDSDADGVIDQREHIYHQLDGGTMSFGFNYFGGYAEETEGYLSAKNFDGSEVTARTDNLYDGDDRSTKSSVLTKYSDGSVRIDTSWHSVADRYDNSASALLTRTVSRTTSADGRTTTTSFDVDANGTADEISTTFRHVDGSTVTTTTDNAAARAFKLSPGDLRWVSAFSTQTMAAATRTTVSADGLKKTVEADYDGNGTYEHVENWTARIDGVQSVSIADKNAAGAIVASGTRTVSADGLTTRLSVDNGNNGTIDREETLRTRIDGTKTKTIVEYDAGGAVIKTTVTEITADDRKVIDTITVSAAYTLKADEENLTITGTSNIALNGNGLDNVLIGNSGTNTIVGGAGNDTLDGGDGVDSLKGGAGNDTYLLRTGDTITELAGEGSDTVISDSTYALGSNVENLTLTGNANINATGNGLANILIGNAGANVLTGGGGNDTYVIGAGDTVIESASQGTDTVQSSVTHVLGLNFENLALTGSSEIDGTGNAVSNVIWGNVSANILMGGGGNDTLYGGYGDDTLDGGTGADLMRGGLGDDTYIVDNSGDSASDDIGFGGTGGGNDTVLASVSFTLATNSHIENLTLTGTSSINATGNGLNNTLIGNTATNIVTGGGGADSLWGGLGSDTFVYSALSDSTSAAQDRIEDFSSGDRIKLLDVDANDGISGDQAFALDTDSSFSAGEIRQTVVGSDLLLEINVDGDIAPEMSILIVGRTTNLTNSDFIF